MKTTIYIATHKEFSPPKRESYVPLQVGAALHAPLSYLRDDIGASISQKNAHYCELTGLYWIWKNDKSSDIVGLAHYRRYFTSAFFSTSEKHFLGCEQIKLELQNYDIILPKPEPLRQTAWEEYYMVSGLEKDLRRVEKIITDLYPQYLPTFKAYFHGNKSYLFNMMICKKELFDKYCEWLFKILFLLEKQVDWSDYDAYQSRLFGFMSERLLNVWVLHQRLRVKEFRTVNTEMSEKERIKIALRRGKNELIFHLHARGRNI